MNLTAEQQAILDYQGSSTVLGGPGTGKTTLLLERVARLVEAGVSPKSICVLVFTYRNLLLMRDQLRRRLPEVGHQVALGTTVDLPLRVIAKAGKDVPRVADNTVVRRMLKQAMADVAFGGSLQEAEHIMRNFKSRGRKPAETDAHYNLFQAYKKHLESSGLLDRHDLVRKHIIGMRNDIYGPVPVKYMLVDNIQDATQIQLLWLVDQMKAGVKVTACGSDDLCQFSRDGALGAQAFTDFEELGELKRFTLQQGFRLPKELVSATYPVVKEISGRLLQAPVLPAQQRGELIVKSFETVKEEMGYLRESVGKIYQSRGQLKVGIITRTDLQARLVERTLRDAGYSFTSFARTIWETPGALMVLDLLDVVLNRATNNKLRNVLTGFGLTTSAVDILFSHGLVADGWLKRGAPVPNDIEEDMPTAAVKELSSLRRHLLSSYGIIERVGAKTVFKAMAYDLINRMQEDDQVDAIHAFDELMAIKGELARLQDIIRKRKDPDPAAKVTVAPVREVRNMNFTHTFVPFANDRSYPYSYRVLDDNSDCERRLLYMALTRASRVLLVTYSSRQSPYLKHLESKTHHRAA